MVHWPVPGEMRTRQIASLRRPVAAPGPVTACRRVAVSVVSLVYDAGASPAASTTGSVVVSLTELLAKGALLRDLGDLVGDGLLRLVRVVRPRVDLELGEHRPAEGALGQHAADGLLDRPIGTRGEQLGVGDAAQSAGVAGVPAGELLLPLGAGQGDLR